MLTIERAILALERKTTIPGDGFEYEEICEAIDMAIDVLKERESRLGIQSSICSLFYGSEFLIFGAESGAKLFISGCNRGIWQRRYIPLFVDTRRGGAFGFSGMLV